MKKSLICWLAMLAICLGSSLALAAGDVYVVGGGSGVGTKIASLPCIITAPGYYYLVKNLRATVSATTAIRVKCGGVTIDLMGFTLTGGTGTGEGDGILLESTTAEIRNGKIEAFEGSAIAVSTDSNSVGHRIINIQAANNNNGINLGAGRSHLISGCTLWQNSGTAINTRDSLIKGNVVQYNQNGITADYSLIMGNLVTSNTSGNITGTNNTLIDNRTTAMP